MLEIVSIIVRREIYSSCIQRISLPCCARSLASQFPGGFEYFGDVPRRGQQDSHGRNSHSLQLAVVEDLRHVLVEPFDFVAGGESEVFRLLITEICNLFSFDADPLRRANSNLALSTNCCHCCEFSMVRRARYDSCELGLSDHGHRSDRM